MSAVARVRAQAKVNLFLRILTREASGYHGIETLFARIALVDDVVVRPTAGSRSVECLGADAGPAEANLAWRAAVAYADATGWPAGFGIELTKRIPVGGGLGGGSADAGAVLRALNALAPAALSHPALLEIAGTLGADVPFMTMDVPLALAWGRGDRLLAMPPLPAAAMRLAVFGFGVSSAAAYTWVAERRGRSRMPVAARAIEVGTLASWPGVAMEATNDFEEEVTRRHPEIASALAAARSGGALLAQLSGSGATVFAIARPGATPGFGDLPSDARVIETTTAVSVEDVVVTR
jgi:4-diphosphocytidyl-2-C-methyl-D-erythritol kinase